MMAAWAIRIGNQPCWLCFQIFSDTQGMCQPPGACVAPKPRHTCQSLQEHSECTHAGSQDGLMGSAQVASRGQWKTLPSSVYHPYSGWYLRDPISGIRGGNRAHLSALPKLGPVHLSFRISWKRLMAALLSCSSTNANLLWASVAKPWRQEELHPPSCSTNKLLVQTLFPEWHTRLGQISH